MKDILGKRAALLSEAEQIVAKETLEPDEKERMESILREVEGLDEEYKLRSLVTQKLDESKRSIGTLTAPEPPAPEKTGWRSFGEFVRAACMPEYRQPPPQEMTTGAAGGFLVPDEFKDVLLQAATQAGYIRPRSTVIPASADHPDTSVEIPVLDYSAGRYAGVSVTWIGEGEIKPSTDINFDLVKLTPKEVAAHIPVTDRLLRNTDAIGPLCGTLMSKAIAAAEDDAFLNSAVGGPLGILDALCVNAPTLYIVRAVANQIAYGDVLNMLARALPGGNYVWLASPTTIPQLCAMAGVVGQTAFQYSQTAGVAGTLMGYPVILNERNPVLGAEGDLCLLDLSFYLIKDGYGIEVSSDDGKYMFPYNLTYIKAFKAVDGQPWLRTLITLEDGATTVSPFVVLDDDAV